MKLLLGSDAAPIAEALRQLVRQAREASPHTLRIMSPWVTGDGLARLLTPDGAGRRADLRLLFSGRAEDVLGPITNLDAVGEALDWGGEARVACDLHAKVFIANHSLAILGSSNLTKAGLERNLEAAVLLDDPEQIGDMVVWFDQAFARAQPIDREWITTVKAQRSAVAPALKRLLEGVPRVPSVGFGARSAAAPSAGQGEREVAGGDGLPELVSRTRRAPSRKWAEEWFELARRLIEPVQADIDDPRLHLYLSVDRPDLAITVGSRYVLAAHRTNGKRREAGPVLSDAEGRGRLDLILPARLVDEAAAHSDFVYAERFRTMGREDGQPTLARFLVRSPFDLPERFVAGAREAVHAEWERTGTPRFADWPNSLPYFSAIVDVAARQRVVDAAFA